MDTTTVVAIVGLVTTLAAPLIGELLRARSARRQRLMDRRIEVYSRLLDVTAELTANTSSWSSMPLADFSETTPRELDRTISAARVIANRRVYELTQEIRRKGLEFYIKRDEAQTLHRIAREEGEVDNTETVRSRLALGAIADEVADLQTHLEREIRRPGVLILSVSTTLGRATSQVARRVKCRPNPLSTPELEGPSRATLGALGRGRTATCHRGRPALAGKEQAQLRADARSVLLPGRRFLDVEWGKVQEWLDCHQPAGEAIVHVAPARAGVAAAEQP